MTILNVAYPFAPVSLDAVGGAEQVLAVLDRGLTAAGEESLVLGSQGSIVCGKLIERQANATINDAVRSRTYLDYVQAIRDIADKRQVDVIHMHGVDFAQYIPDTGTPVLVTLHLPFDYYEPSALKQDNVIFNLVSQSQRRDCPPHIVPAVVCNGVDTDAFSPGNQKGDFALALGRICPEKGFHLALQATALADVDCVLAGQVYGYADHQRYFTEEIVPRLDDRRRFVGPVGGQLKRWLLSAAKCVLIPSLVAETSSLVAMEALAAGTPVVAFRNGALIEIVEHLKTGLLVDNAEEMAQAIREVEQIDPRLCRYEARRRFCAGEMVANYIRLYRSIIGGRLSPTLLNTGLS